MTTPQLLTLGGLAFGLVSCGAFKNFNQPLSGSGDFDPLSTPGSSSGQSVVVAPASPTYKPGQWVETSMPNATFFRSIPKGNATADKVLPAATPMKVVSSKGTYIKVELDSGEVGYVPEIWVIERGNAGLGDPTAPLPDLGAVPPPVDPGDVSGETIAPPPEVPGTPPPVPTVPSLPLPALPDAPPPVPEVAPTVPDVAPPPEVPGITDPVDVD